MRRLVVGVAIISLAALALSWAQADDQEIAKEITERLKQEQKIGKLHDFNINLKVADGQVLLKGQVASEEQQKLALDVARATKGVKDVVNDLQIQAAAAAETAGEKAPSSAEQAKVKDADKDQQIAQQITTALKGLKQSGKLKGFDLDLSVQDGVVAYVGQISNAEQMQLALDVARQTPGVRDVVNKLVVVESAPKAAAAEVAKTAAPAAMSRTARDSEIAKEIAAALKQRKAAGDLKGFDIEVVVKDGVVTYTGRVSNPEQIQLAAKIADGTAGVRRVVNQLVISESKAVAASQPTPAAEPIALQPKARLAIQEVANKLPANEPTVAAVERPVAQTIAYPTTVAEVKPANYRHEVSEASAEAQPEPRPAPMAKGPSTVALGRAIEERLNVEKQRGALRGSHLEAQIVGGQVFLKGLAASEEQHQIAMDAVSRVPGVQRVVDAVVVASPGEVQAAMPVAYPMTQAPVSNMAVAPRQTPASTSSPRPLGAIQTAAYVGAGVLAAPVLAVSQIGQAADGAGGAPAQLPGPGYAQVPARYDHPNLPGYAWPSYAAAPNYAAVTYPKQYSPTAWPYIGPFYPYPQVPPNWRKVTLNWHDGWWQLNFKSK